MPIKLITTGGGSVTLDANSTASNYTLTAPARSGAIITSADSNTVTQGMLATNVAGTGPVFRAYKSGSSTTGFSLTTWTKVVLDTETFDTASCFDSTTNYRFTPNVAGYYSITGSVKSNWSGSQWTAFFTGIYKNGSLYSDSICSTASTVYPTVNITDLVYMNGSTDYLELYVYATGGSSPTYNQGSDQTFMTGYLVRAA